MTEEERQKLVESMRNFDLANFDPYAALEEAADEIERLAKALEEAKRNLDICDLDRRDLQ